MTHNEEYLNSLVGETVSVATSDNTNGCGVRGILEVRDNGLFRVECRSAVNEPVTFDAGSLAYWAPFLDGENVISRLQLSTTRNS